MANRDIDITIGYDSLYDEIGKATGYTGAKASEDGSLYHALATQDEDAELLRSFVLDAEESVAESLYIYLADSNYEEGIRYTLRMPTNWHRCEEELRKAIFWYMVYYAAMRWFRTVGGEVGIANEEKYKADCTEKLDDVRRFVNRRSRPVNPHRPAVFDQDGLLKA